MMLSVLFGMWCDDNGRCGMVDCWWRRLDGGGGGGVP